MKKKLSKQEMWRMAFREVIDQYQEAKAADGGIGALNYEGAIGSSTGKNNGGGTRMRTVMVSLSDFICDVELAAQRVLNPKEQGFWLAYYVGLADDSEIPNNETKDSIKLKVGKMLIARGIYPLGQYFRPVDCR